MERTEGSGLDGEEAGGEREGEVGLVVLEEVEAVASESEASRTAAPAVMELLGERAEDRWTTVGRGGDR